MKIPPAYTITPDILQLIVQIEANRIFLNSLNINPEISQKLQRISILKSSLYSARIEGNPLTIEEIESTPKHSKKREVFNILATVKYIEKEPQINADVTQKYIVNLHKMVMKDLSPDAGRLRHEMGAIFNQAGIAIYLSPPPNQIQHLLNKLLDYINKDTEKFPVITAFIAHLIFEKIHPFLDGNGRLGRLLIYAILRKKNLRFNLHIALEEYLDQHKDDYYYFLDIGMKHTEDYLTFMLRSFWEQTQNLKSQLLQESEKRKGILLPPRQEEIYNIIRDHKMVNFDNIKRRFLKVPSRTLRYDIKKLQDKGLVKKLGSTKGSYYSIG